MSDRTQGSVRTESPAGDGAATKGDAPPASSTQSIPTTGSQRAQGASGGTRTTGQSGGGPAEAPATGTSAKEAEKGAATKGAAAKDSGTETGSGRGVRGRGPSRPGGRGPRRARLQLRHIDTWSALKISLVLSIALFFVWMVAVGVLYAVLSGLEVFDTLNDLFGQIGSASGEGAGGEVITPGVVFGGAAIIGAINIVLMTALCTVGTFIYNLCSDLVGGLELMLSERD